MTQSAGADDGRRLDALLEQWLDGDEDVRRGMLRALREQGSDLAERLERLVAHLEITDRLGEQQLGAIFDEALRGDPGIAAATRMGEWSLGRCIGVGGMSEVYLGEREIEGITQQAAIKLVAQARNPDRGRRFLDEAAFLTRLDDPRIAGLIDAGVTPEGQAWLATSFVDGDPIDRHCKERGLDVRATVALMIDVAEAVAHAHQRLVIHRDLKPGNVLVNDEGQVRLLDFGIAKSLLPESEGDSETATHARAFTLRFTSPEQLHGRPTTTASDVYQLGALLYLLLSGHRAFESVDDQPAALALAMADGPRPPSQALMPASPVTESPEATSRRRRRSRELAGDLDRIVLHAMQHDPANRYPGARELALDLQRWLDGEPVLAAGPGTAYRLRHFARKHWASVALSLLAAVALLTYAVTVTVQSSRLAEQRNLAEAARVRAEAMHEFVLSILAGANPYDHDQTGQSLDQVLDEALDEAESKFGHDPELAVSVLHDLGEVLHLRSRLDQADRAFRQAYQIRRRTSGEEALPTLDALEAWAKTLHAMGRHEEARDAHRRAQPALRAMTELDPGRLAESLQLLARNEAALGEADVAERLLAEALRLSESMPPGAGRDDQLTVILVDQANGLFAAERYAEAEPMFRRAIDTASRLHGADHPYTLTIRTNLAAVLRARGDASAAERELLSVLSAQRTAYAAPHRDSVMTLGHLARTAEAQGRWVEARAYWQQGIDESRVALGEGHPSISRYRFARTATMIELGDRDAAARELAALRDDAATDRRILPKIDARIAELGEASSADQ